MTTRPRRLPSGFWKGASGRSTRRSKSTRAVKSLAPKARKAVATIAKRVFNKKTETKFASTAMPTPGNPLYQAIYGATYPTGGVPQLFTCVPQIQQGDTTFERQGNKIQPTRHYTDLQFVFNEDNQALIYTPPGGTPTAYSIAQAGWDLTVHVWYGFAKRFKRVDNVTALANTTQILQTMLQDGQGNNVEWNGLPTDDLLDIDRDIVTLKHKKFRMYKNAGLANVGDPVSPSLTTPMSTAHKMRISWKPPKTLLYGEDTNIVPENYAPFVVIGYCHNDGTPASNTGNTGPTSDLSKIPAIKFFKVDRLYYKDA